jgi:hypothetical protein
MERGLPDLAAKRAEFGGTMLLLALIILVLWGLGFLVFHLGGGLIHILLIIALIVIVVRVIKGRRPI